MLVGHRMVPVVHHMNVQMLVVHRMVPVDRRNLFKILNGSIFILQFIKEHFISLKIDDFP